MPTPMKLLAFLTEISCKGIAANVSRVPDPLNAALRLIDPTPTTPQARLLIRLLDAIANDVGEFRMTELSLLDADTLALAVSLKDAWEASVYTAKQWKQAARTADWRLRATEAIARW